MKCLFPCKISQLGGGKGRAPWFASAGIEFEAPEIKLHVTHEPSTALQTLNAVPEVPRLYCQISPIRGEAGAYKT